jgi:hypothetical protein
MSGTDATGGRDRADAARERRRFGLHSVVVSYDGRPDRCTIYPRGRHPEARVTTWFSADIGAFVGLEEMR